MSAFTMIVLFLNLEFQDDNSVRESLKSAVSVLHNEQQVFWKMLSVCECGIYAVYFNAPEHGCITAMVEI